MAYKLKKNTRIDLSELGEDSAGNPFFVEIKNTKLMTYDEKMEFLKFAPKKDAEFTAEMANNLKEVAGSLIVSWNLLSLKDETPLSIPCMDPKALNEVPSEVIEIIMKSMAGKLSATDEATKNSSVQLAK